jgi:hypothetical protein
LVAADSAANAPGCAACAAASPETPAAPIAIAVAAHALNPRNTERYVPFLTMQAPSHSIALIQFKSTFTFTLLNCGT